MAQAYRLEVAAPNTGAVSAFSTSAAYQVVLPSVAAGLGALTSSAAQGAASSIVAAPAVFSPETNNVVEIDLQLKKDGHTISFLTATLYDPNFAIFNQLPDPAFANVPVRLYLAAAEQGSLPPVLVFDGKMTSLQMAYPEYDKITVVAHDNSIDMRRTKAYRTFKNKTGLQIVQSIASQYGFTLSEDSTVSAGSPRSIEFGAEISDWDLMRRCLAFDGLSVYVKGKTLFISQTFKTVYATTFVKDQYPVMSLDVQINHVAGPGGGGDRKTTVSLENSGSQQAIVGAKAKEAQLAAASERTHRRPIGAPTSSAGSHAESPANQAFAAIVDKMRRRKDQATLTVFAIPDINLGNKAKLQGWGGKVDGEWFVDVINHKIVSGDYPSTVLSLRRAPSAGAATQAGIPFAT